MSHGFIGPWKLTLSSQVPQQTGHFLRHRESVSLREGIGAAFEPLVRLCGVGGPAFYYQKGQTPAWLITKTPPIRRPIFLRTFPGNFILGVGGGMEVGSGGEWAIATSTGKDSPIPGQRSLLIPWSPGQRHPCELRRLVLLALHGALPDVSTPAPVMVPPHPDPKSVFFLPNLSISFSNVTHFLWDPAVSGATWSPISV